jgi:type I restriction enzyme S subunit
MSSKEWKRYKLEDLVDSNRGISYGIVQPGEFLKSGGVPILKVNNLTENKTGLQDVFRVSNEVESKYERTRLRGNEILVSLVGSLGHVFKTSEKQKGWNVVRAIGVLPIKEEINRDWVYWCLKSPEIQTAFGNLATVTVQATLNLKELREIEIPIPDENTQHRIADILSALDEKIELNHQINATLEAIAQAIFKEWFVDFNFPGATGEMVESELGMIPSGWRVGKLGEILTNFDSKRVPLSSRERETRKGNYPYYGAASIVDYVNDYLFDGVYLLMGEDGTVITDDEKPVLQYVTGKFWVNNHAHVLRGVDPSSTEYIYLLLKNTNIKHLVTGAVQPKINQGNMNGLPVIIPRREILYAFQKIIQPIFFHILEVEQQSDNLTSIRDALLPKLMNGEIEV